MKLKRNLIKRPGRTILHVLAASGAVEAGVQAFTSSGDVGLAAKTFLVVAGTAVASFLHGWLDNMLPTRRFADKED